MIRQKGKHGVEKSPVFQKRNIDEFNTFIEKRILNKMSFELIKNGSTRTMKSLYHVNNYILCDYEPNTYFISMVKRMVKNRIDNGLVKTRLYKKEFRPLFVFLNSKNVIKHNGERICALDFKRCYWTTLHKIGYIDDSLYEKGINGVNKKDRDGNLKFDSLKDVCNMSVGSMNKSVTKEVYVDGVMVSSETILNPLKDVRTHVIDCVKETAFKIINNSKQTKEGFLWFLTDCFFVTESSAAEYERLMNDYGYECHKTFYDKYDVSSSISKYNGRYKYFVKWKFDDEFSGTYNFNYKLDILNLNDKRNE